MSESDNLEFEKKNGDLALELLQALITRRVKHSLTPITDDFKGFLSGNTDPDKLTRARMLTLEMMRNAFMDFYASAGSYTLDPNKQNPEK